MKPGHLYLKDGVEISGLHPGMIRALPIICRVLGSYKSPAVCTSGTDGDHMDGSLHYEHKALDWRIWYIERWLMQGVITDLKAELGEDYDVVLESTHIHIEYDKRGRHG